MFCEIFQCSSIDFNPLLNGPFRGSSRMGDPSKICHTYPTIMKLGSVIPYLKKIQITYKSPDTPPLISLSLTLATFVISRNRSFFIILISFDFLKVVLINMTAILMMSPNWLPSLLKINLFQNKGYDVIIFVHDVINKIL